MGVVVVAAATVVVAVLLSVSLEAAACVRGWKA